MVKDFDLISKIKKINPKNDLLILSYKFNIDFFENFILPQFINNSFPLILIDYNEYQNNILKFGESKFIEKKYFIDSVNLKNVRRKFHPKLLLSLGKKELKIWIGSNNLTIEGYTDNAEILVPININLDNIDDHGLLIGICDFIESLKSLVQSSYHYEQLSNLLERLLNIIHKNPVIKNDKHWIIHNIKETLMKQVLEKIKEPIQKIEVIAPYFAQNEDFYIDLSNICDSVNIIVQQFRNNLPVDKLSKFNNFTYSILNVPNNRFLHAKILIFKTEYWDYILAGSANLTKSALTTNYNIELAVLIKNKKEISDITRTLGEIYDVKLNDIEVEELKPFEIISHDYSFRILSSCLVGNNQLKIELDNLTEGSVNLYLNDIKKNYKYIKQGKILKFEIPENDVNAFLTNNFVRIEVNFNEEILKSDFRLIHNPILFPIKYKLLNTFNINDPNWLIEIILKLASLPENKIYLPILKDLDEKEIFTRRNRERGVSEMRKKMNSSRSIPNYTLNNLIDDLIKNNTNKINRAIRDKRVRNPYEIIDTFILSNKLIIGAALLMPNYFQSKISNIRFNFNNLLLSKLNYFSRFSKSEQIRLVKQNKLKYHALIVAFITAQLQLNEIKKNPQDKYENVKERFDFSSTLFIQKLINIEDNIINETILKEHFQEYSSIYKQILRISINKFLADFNEFMLKTYKNNKADFNISKLNFLTFLDR